MTVQLHTRDKITNVSLQVYRKDTTDEFCTLTIQLDSGEGSLETVILYLRDISKAQKIANDINREILKLGKESDVDDWS